MSGMHASGIIKQRPAVQSEANTLAEPLLAPVESNQNGFKPPRWPERAGTASSALTLSSAGTASRSTCSSHWGHANSIADIQRDFHEHRMQVLSGEQRSMDVLQPYAVLHLNVQEARRVLPSDFLGRSDPYVVIYVNDTEISTSPANHFTLNPKWNHQVDIDVYSPFTMVRILVVDHDTFATDDPMGFVEFRVAELIPGGEFTGWFEIRLMDNFIFDANKRFKAHRIRRDDNPLPLLRPPPDENGNGNEQTMLTRTMSNESKAGDLQHFHQHASANKRRKKGRSSCFFGMRNSSPGVSKGVFGHTKSRLNGGHLHVSMQLEVLYKPEHPPAALPSMWRILAGALVNDLEHLQLEDEWYACCFPRPVPQAVERKRGIGVEFGDHNLNLPQINRISHSAMKVKTQVLDGIMKPMMNLAWYILSWRARSLSLSLLIYWSFFVGFPFECLASLPLYFAMWLYILRRTEWTNAMFAHQDLIPLSSVGLEMVIALRDGRKMNTWLKRLVEDQGGWVTDRTQLLQYAKLLEYGHRTNMEGLPSFEKLCEELKSQPWISWHVRHRKRCLKCNDQVLEFWGSGAYRPNNDGWACASGPRLCLDVVADKGRKLGRREASRKGLHLGVPRYHCPECQRDFCGECLSFEQSASIMATMMSVPLLGSRFDRVQEQLVDFMAKVDEVSNMAEAFLYAVEKLTRADEKVLARKLYIGCFFLSFIFCAMQSLHWLLSLILRWTFQILVAFMGIMFLLQQAGPLRRARTAYRATSEYRKIQRLREEGGGKRWKFYTKDLPQSTP